MTPVGKQSVNDFHLIRSQVLVEARLSTDYCVHFMKELSIGNLILPFTSDMLFGA